MFLALSSAHLLTAYSVVSKVTALKCLPVVRIKSFHIHPFQMRKSSLFHLCLVKPHCTVQGINSNRYKTCRFIHSDLRCSCFQSRHACSHENTELILSCIHLYSLILRRVNASYFLNGEKQSSAPVQMLSPGLYSALLLMGGLLKSSCVIHDIT